MSLIKKILAPTDCSETSKDTINFALNLKKKHDAKLTILYITTPPEYIDEFSDTNNLYRQIADQTVAYQ